MMIVSQAIHPVQIHQPTSMFAIFPQTSFNRCTTICLCPSRKPAKIQKASDSQDEMSLIKLPDKRLGRAAGDKSSFYLNCPSNFKSTRIHFPSAIKIAGAKFSSGPADLGIMRVNLIIDFLWLRADKCRPPLHDSWSGGTPFLYDIAGGITGAICLTNNITKFTPRLIIPNCAICIQTDPVMDVCCMPVIPL